MFLGKTYSIALNFHINIISGLYRAAIAQSGSALCPWAYQRDFTIYPLMLATNANPDMPSNATETEIFEFLKTLPGHNLKMAFQDLEVF